MSPKFSIVIPTLNAEASLPATLDSLLPGLSDGVIRELIISDGGSTDATRQLADDVGSVLVTGKSGRGDQLVLGAEAAVSDWILFLHADTRLDADWVGAAMIHVQTQPETAAAFRLRFDATGLMPRLVAFWANSRSRLFGLPYGDQGLLISKALYDEVGGFPKQPLMEDVAIARALKGRLILLPTHVTTNAEKYVKSGWIRRGASNLILLVWYLCGADPQKLAQAYHKR